MCVASTSFYIYVHTHTHTPSLLHWTPHIFHLLIYASGYVHNTHFQIGIKDKDWRRKSSHHETHSEKSSIPFMVPRQISSQVASPEMMIVSSQCTVTSVKNPVTPFPQNLYMNCPIQLHFLAIPSSPHSQICL
jgi:hypothetical protein